MKKSYVLFITLVLVVVFSVLANFILETNSLKNEAFISDPLKNKGVEMGKILNTNPNTLEIYLIFNKDFNGDILVKIKDMNNQEIGRSKLNLNKKEGEAGYIQFNFSELTTIETQSKIYIE